MAMQAPAKPLRISVKSIFAAVPACLRWQVAGRANPARLAGLVTCLQASASSSGWSMCPGAMLCLPACTSASSSQHLPSQLAPRVHT
jgi:hypothetical protein